MKLKLNKRQGWISLLLLIIFSAPVFAQDVEESLREFSELKVFNGVEVKVFPSDENRISITGHSKEKVKFEVVEDRLEIRLSLEHIWSDDNTLVKVYAKDLQVIDANESAIVDVTEQLQGNSLTFRSQEGAAIYAPISAQSVSTKAVTGGLVQLRGTSEELTVEVNTGGKFFGRDLKSREAEIYTGTGGLSEVYASEFAKATAKLGGVIEVYGNPKKFDHKTSLGGKISKKNE